MGENSMQKHFASVKKGVEEHYKVAEKARAKGLDPVGKVEVPVATTLAEKSIGLISTVYPQLQDGKIVARILELEKEYGQLDTAVAFKIAEEIAREKFCKFKDLMEAIDAGIRVGFAYITLGVVSSPIEGFTELKLGKTTEGKDYFIAYFSGPIRSAGTTASCVALMLIDYLRECFGFAKYDPTEEEVKRYVTENYDYHERVTNLQYLPTEEEISFLAKNLPIQIAGDPTENREVSNYKDLDRVDTSFIRGGMCLIFSEGLAQKAQKGLRLWRGVQKKGFKCSGWEFLDEYIELLNKKGKEGEDSGPPTYIRDLVAGRPVFGHPSKSGGFRLRYGVSRTSGFSATAVHPVTMAITNGFLSFGTQLKIEKPTKGCAIGVCDEMDGPIVKLRDGSVKRVENFEEARKIYGDVEEIIYLGDLLIPLGDIINRNYELMKVGYCEEWWALELEKAGFSGKLEKFEVGFEEALDLSKKFLVALYPRYIYYWSEIGRDDFLGLLDWLARGKLKDGKLVLPYNREESERFKKGKRALELIGVEHEVTVENVVLSKKESNVLLFNLGISVNGNGVEEKFDEVIRKVKDFGKKESVLEIVNGLCKLEIKDKSGTFIGARMGRPEKAKLRKLTGSPHVIFPVGEEGGRLRSFQAAVEVGSVRADFPIYYCSNCEKEEVYPSCKDCGKVCRRMMYCRDCDKNYIGKCEEHEGGFEYNERKIDIVDYYDNARKKLGMRSEELPIVKGVRGTSSGDHSCENLVKGLLRAKHGLNVNKDGTIRYDMTEMPLTFFKPKEIGTNIEKLRELGYEFDFKGKKLESDDQIIRIFPHDVVLPACPETLDEKADDVFLNISRFVDDELEKMYGLERFYNAEKKEDLIGQLVVCIAPHICTASVGRLIGFSKTQTFLASPYMHAAMRRDCDGDEAAAMLLMDMLVNFSRKYLPAHRGGTQDAPLVLNTQIRAGEVDDQILDFECEQYGLDLYEGAEEGKHSSELEIENVKSVLKKGGDGFEGLAFTHDCDDINHCIVNTSYKILPTMGEKVAGQMELCKKIRAVDTSDVARLIIERHFVRDTRGNLRKFSMQVFRCVGCNSKYRRPPLTGKCTKCGGRLIFTIAEGSVLKYMQRSLDLAREYKVSDYILESLELTEMYIQSIFGKEKEKQEPLNKWFGS